MDPTTIGTATLQARAEGWEGDFNGHWNARFYSRTFQLAAETIACRPGAPDRRAVETRHIRFHRELFVHAAVEVRSARISTGEHAGAVVHILSGEGQLAATAIDWPGTGGETLPAVAAEAVRLAFPRGLSNRSAAGWEPDRPETAVAETGPVRPTEIDGTGALLAEEVVRRVGIGTHGLLNRIGFTVEFTAETGISRMAVESRITAVGACRVGRPLRVRSQVSSIGSRSFSTKHWLDTHDGETVAMVDNALVAVDLKARRAVSVPDFLRRLRDSADAA